jgi:hypothetical protein
MELRFVSRESDYLVFETSDGQRLRAVLDDSLKDAVRKNNQTQSSSISPREVQDAIRAGETVAEIANRFGVTREEVEPFAAPILDELRFVLQSALNTSLSAGDRMRSFEDLVLKTYPSAEFSIRKTDGAWVIHAGNSLSWSFDPKSRLLEPISTAAKELSKSFSTEREIIPSPKPVITAPEPVVEEQGQGASVHDLVQELRARRNPEEIRPASAKGRASLPSWDEIVLGTTSLESDSD